MATTTSERVNEMYNFEDGLAQVERLELLIASPLLHLTSAQLPRHGMSTKPALADPAALMVVGAATVICGSDRAAQRELRAHWPRLRAAFRAAGYRVPETPLEARHFRDYRDRVLSGALPDEWKAEASERFCGLAVEIGLFPETDAPWNTPNLDGIVTSDGTWFAAASEVTDMTKSRSTTGSPRVVTDADAKNKYDKKGWGYMFCITSVRGGPERERVVLDISFAPNSAEMDVVIPTARRLRNELGDRFRWFVFDGAMRGTHHRELRSLGLLTINKPAGIRRIDQWKQHRDTALGKGAKVLEPDLGCGDRHLVTVTGGMFWDLERTTDGGYRRRRVLEHTEIRRKQAGDGFAWELDVALRCGSGTHIWTLDPNSTIKCATGATLMGGGPLHCRSTVNLSEQLRVLPPNDELFAAAYGRRNDSESGNKSVKSDFDLGHRARSYTRLRHETDLWIYALLANSIAWQEHRQRNRCVGRRAA